MRALDESLFGLHVAGWYGQAVAMAYGVILVAYLAHWWVDRRSAQRRAHQELARLHAEHGAGGSQP